MSAREYLTNSEDETIALGREIAAGLPRPGLVLLIGNLGAGKTTLTKGIVEGLGVATLDEVTSPTFTLIHEYGSNVYHIDLYRLETEAEVKTLGLDDLLDQDSILLIEWGERFPRLWPKQRTEILIQTTADQEQRQITRRELI